MEAFLPPPTPRSPPDPHHSLPRPSNTHPNSQSQHPSKPLDYFHPDYQPGFRHLPDAVPPEKPYPENRDLIKPNANTFYSEKKDGFVWRRRGGGSDLDEERDGGLKWDLLGDQVVSIILEYYVHDLFLNDAEIFKYAQPYWFRFRNRERYSEATRWYRYIFIAKKIDSFRGLSSTWQYAVENSSIHRIMLPHFGYGDQALTSAKSPEPECTQEITASCHCWICPAEVHLPAPCHVNLAKERLRQNKSSNLLPLRTIEMEVANLGYIPVCKDHEKSYMCNGCWETDNSRNIRKAWEYVELDYEVLYTDDTAAFGIGKESFCQSCREAAVARALAEKGEQRLLGWEHTDSSWRYVKKAEGTASEAAEALIHQAFFSYQVPFREGLNHVHAVWSKNRRERLNKKRYAPTNKHLRKIGWCDRNGLDKDDYNLVEQHVVNLHIDRLIKAGCWVLPSELWRMNRKYNFQQQGPDGKHPFTSYPFARPLSRATFDATYGTLSASLVCGAFRGWPEAIVLRLDELFEAQLSLRVMKLLDGMDDMVFTEAGNDKDIYRHKIKAISPAEMLAWMREPRTHVKGWYTAFGQSLVMEDAILKMKAGSVGQKRKRAAGDTGAAVGNAATVNETKRRKSDPQTEAKPAEVDMEMNGSVDERLGQGGTVDVQMQPEDPAVTVARGVDPAVLHSSTISQEVTTKAAILALPWPRPRSDFVRSDEEESSLARNYQKHKFGSQDNFEISVPAPGAYVSPKLFEVFQKRWECITDSDLCYCATCRRVRDEVKAAQKLRDEEREKIAKLEAELSRMRTMAAMQPKVGWKAYGNSVRHRPHHPATGVKIIDRSARPKNSTTDKEQSYEAAPPVRRTPPLQIVIETHESLDEDMDELIDENRDEIDLTLDDESSSLEYDEAWEDEESSNEAYYSDEV